MFKRIISTIIFFFIMTSIPGLVFLLIKTVFNSRPGYTGNFLGAFFGAFFAFSFLIAERLVSRYYRRYRKHKML